MTGVGGPLYIRLSGDIAGRVPHRSIPPADGPGVLVEQDNEVYKEFFPGTPPPRYCVQVGLVLPELLVEIQSVADTGGV